MLGLMNNKEGEIFQALELQEDLAALDYLYRRGISASLVFDRENYAVDLFDILPHGGVAESDFSGLSHGVVTACFPSMPNGDLCEEAKKLSGNLNSTKRNLLLGMRNSDGAYSDEEIDLVEKFEIEHVAEFANGVFSDLTRKSYFDLPADEAWKRDAIVLYWLRVRTVAIAALAMADGVEESSD